MLKLYHWEPVGNSGEPLLLLKEKGIDVKAHYVDLLAFEQHTPAFLKINPQGQVPVLVHDGKIVTETTLMLFYIEAAFPERPFLPGSAQERYQVHVWSKYADEYLAPSIAMLGWHQTTYPKMKDRLEGARAGIAKLPPERQAVWQLALDDAYTQQELASARGRLAVRIGRLEETLSTSRYIAGSSYSLADIMVFFFARALPALAPNLVSERATPHIIEWLSLNEARPAVRATLAMARTPHPETVFAPGPEMPRWG